MIADPQLVDNHTYPSYGSLALGITKHTSDVYLRRNYRALSKALRPDSIVFLGDLLDNGRSSQDAYYMREVSRFRSIFRDYNGIGKDSIITSLPGNHDVGWKNGVKLSSVKRFESNFGAPKPYEIFNTLFVPLDVLSLANTENQDIYSKPRKMLEEIEALSKDKPRVLLTHVPLMRPKEASCGPLREVDKFPFVEGYQFQTVLDGDLSDEILEKVKPDLVFLGDDHDYCFITHTYKEGDEIVSVNEITVKSMSMTMGVLKPAVELLTIIDENPEDAPTWDRSKVVFNTEICYLPTPFNDIILCVIMAVISGLVIIANTYFVVIKQKRYYGYSKVQTKPNTWGAILRKFHTAKKESPYAASTSTPMEAYNIDIEEDRDEYLRSISNYRRRARTRANTVFYSSKITFRALAVKMASIILAEFVVMGLVAFGIYKVFVFFT